MFDKFSTNKYFDTLDKYFRAANYISACQLYLLDNPLLRDHKLYFLSGQTVDILQVELGFFKGDTPRNVARYDNGVVVGDDSPPALFELLRIRLPSVAENVHRLVII